MHFGLLAVKPAAGRRFGGVGVMIEAPGCEFVFEQADSDLVTGDNPSAVQRVQNCLSCLRQRLPLTSRGVQIHIHQAIPGHRGLGSGTQLSLAIARGVLALADLPPRHAIELATLTGRGQRSAIGVHGFDQGGFLVEAGQQADEISPLILRTDFPPDWRWLLIAPRHSQGLSGPPEQQAFRGLPPMPEATTASLCRLLLMDWIPAMQAADFPAVSAALWDYGRIVGNFFAVAQGDIFASPQMQQLAAELRRDGVTGIAQTSWGPTIAVLCRDKDHAGDVQARATGLPAGAGCDYLVTSGRNRGADVIWS